MATPGSHHARLFYRCGFQRLEDAQILLDGERSTGSMYLGGYSVECLLKVLILSITPRPEVEQVLATFRGSKAHDFEWLRAVYRSRGGPVLPRDIIEIFPVLNEWSSEMRYNPRTYPFEEAEAFLDMVKRFVTFADGRL